MNGINGLRENGALSSAARRAVVLLLPQLDDPLLAVLPLHHGPPLLADLEEVHRLPRAQGLLRVPHGALHLSKGRRISI